MYSRLQPHVLGCYLGRRQVFYPRRSCQATNPSWSTWASAASTLTDGAATACNRTCTCTCSRLQSHVFRLQPPGLCFLPDLCLPACLSVQARGQHSGARGARRGEAARGDAARGEEAAAQRAAGGQHQGAKPKPNRSTYDPAHTSLPCCAVYILSYLVGDHIHTHTHRAVQCPHLRC